MQTRMASRRFPEEDSDEEEISKRQGFVILIFYPQFGKRMTVSAIWESAEV